MHQVSISPILIGTRWVDAVEAARRWTALVALGFRIGADDPVTDRLTGDIVGERDPIAEWLRVVREPNVVGESAPDASAPCRSERIRVWMG